MPVTANADRDTRPAAAPARATEVVVDEIGWLRLIPGAKSLVLRAARAAGGIDTVVLSSDRRVQRLNCRHRGRNAPTNVLSFAPGDGCADGGGGGEIVLARGVVMREAAAAKRTPAQHLAHLVVHGALHLRGFDHQHPGDAKRMEMREARLLHRLRVANPWSNR